MSTNNIRRCPWRDTLALLLQSYLSDRIIFQELSWTLPKIAIANRDHTSIYQFDLSNLEPQIVCLLKLDRVVSISNLPEVPITLAFINSCTGGKIADLAQAAVVLKDRYVVSQVQMYVVSASQLVSSISRSVGLY